MEEMPSSPSWFFFRGFRRFWRTLLCLASCKTNRFSSCRSEPTSDPTTEHQNRPAGSPAEPGCRCCVQPPEETPPPPHPHTRSPDGRPSLSPPPAHTHTVTQNRPGSLDSCFQVLVLTSSRGRRLKRIRSAFSLSWRLSIRASSSLEALSWQPGRKQEVNNPTSYCSKNKHFLKQQLGILGIIL